MTDGYSVDIIEKIREQLATHFSSDKTSWPDDICVIVTGSYGRGEASAESDMDWFIVADKSVSDPNKTESLKAVTDIVNKFVTKITGNTDTFENVIDLETLQTNYGGDLETNQVFTRRMLYLLESKSLFNEEMYKKTKREILEKYIKEGIANHTLNRFMLNDIIRYYRTMCTDFEYKTTEAGKHWATRKIKLRFSRKFLYFAGMLTVAGTSYLTRDEKIKKTTELLDLTPIARVEYIAGKQKSEKLIKYYEEFIEKISQPDVRSELDNVDRKSRDNNDIYLELKNLSQHFEWEMEKIILNCFPPSHPIHAALIF